MLKKIALIVTIVIGMSGSLVGQNTEFTYQGNLKFDSQPANGNFDFEFLLFDSANSGAQVGSTLARNNVLVSAGVFAVSLNFGSEFPGANRFLEIRVRQAGGGAFTTLLPRQPVNSTPYAIKSLNSQTAVFSTSADTAANATNAATAANALQLGGVAANQFVLTSDSRMSDARNPLPGSSNYVQNTNTPQAGVNFNIGGTGTANIVNAATQFNIGGLRAFAITGTGGNLNTNTFAGIGTGQSNTPDPVGGASGNLNSFFGKSVGTANTTGSANSIFGYNAGVANTGGHFNSFFGTNSGIANTTGAVNSFLGNFAGFSNTTESGNTFIGAAADGAAGVMNSTALGYRAKVTQSESLVLGAINGINSATASTRVGIGTTAPVAPLEVVGNWNNVEGALRLTGDRPTLRMTGGAATGNQSWILHMGSIGPGNLEFYRTCGAACWLQSLSMSTTGKVGINVTPSYGLHVVSADNTGLRVQTNSTGGTIASFGGNGAFEIDAPNVVGGRLKVFESGLVQIGTPFTATEKLDVSGHTRIRGLLYLHGLGTGGTTSLCTGSSLFIATCSSSIRYKQNLISYRSGLSLINRLRPVTFNWKADNKEDLGLIAEEVAEVEPLLTFKNDKGEVEGVKYEQLTVVLINAIKQQQAQIEGLQQLLRQQQKQVVELKQELQKTIAGSR